MNRGKGILASLKFIQSRLHLTRISPSPLLYSQASFSPLLLSSLSQYPRFISSQPKLYSSSHAAKNNEWSQGLDNDLLEKFHSTPLTHESVVYILKTLDKTPNKALDFFNWVCDKHEFKPNFIVYNVLLVILSTKETVKEFWDLTGKMSKEGCFLDERAYLTALQKINNFKMVEVAKSWAEYYAKMSGESAKDSLTNGVVDVVLASDWNDTTVKKLEEFKGVLSENAVVKIFHALHKDPFKALFFFRWLKENAGYVHNAVTYNVILRIIWKKESIEEFWKMLKEMESMGHGIDFDTYFLVSRHFRRQKMFEESAELYELMMSGKFKARVQDATLIINELAKTDIPDTDLVTRVVKIHEAAGYDISKAMYDGMHRCFATAGKFDMAEKILGTMRSTGLQPDESTYYHWVFALGKAGKLEEAIEILDNMEAKGYTRHLAAWTNLIHGHFTAGHVEKALESYTLFLEKKYEVDADLLDVLVKGLCEHGRVDSAYSLVTELVSKTSLKPFHATYTNLIHNLVEDKKLKEGISLLHLMKKQDHILVRDPFVDYISKFGTVENAEELLEVLSITKYATVSAHQHVLQSFLKEGRESEARGLLEKFPDRIRGRADILDVFVPLKTGNATV